MNLESTRYEVVIMHEDDHNERKQFDTLAEAVQFMEKEAGAPCVCLPIEPNEETNDKTHPVAIQG